MNLADIKYVHFIGIGGIGMSALARYFNHLGKSISGYDKVRTPLTKALEAENMLVYYEENLSKVPEVVRKGINNPQVLIIYTPAIPASHIELLYFRNSGQKLHKRAEVLGAISSAHPTIAVAGTHGKTSTTSMLAYLIRESKKPFAAFIGGINENFNSNLVLQGNPELFLTEADEYDRSFLQLKPKYAIITSMDADHLDIYGQHEEMEKTYMEFGERVKEDGTLLVQYGLKKKLKGLHFKTYGLLPEADFKSKNVRIDGRETHFDFEGGGYELKNLHLLVPGGHNLMNATAAIAMALINGVSGESIKQCLPLYKGVKRRFEYHINRNDLIYIDDYAHHPEEINALIRSVRKMYPKKKITGVFQPHLYSRTRDFGSGFAESLSQLDEVILLDIYPARELPIEGITSDWLLDQITADEKMKCLKDELISVLDQKKPEVLLTIGAGDIDQLVEPIKIHFSERR